MKNIGYSEFIRICKVDEPDKWCDWLSIQSDGIYVREFSEMIYLTYEERSILTKHPTGNLLEPALRFPCTLDELRAFLEDQAIGLAIEDEYSEKTQEKSIVESSHNDCDEKKNITSTPWTLRKLKRQNTLANMIYKTLKEELNAGHPMPKARDLMEMIKKNKYPEFVELLDAEIKYYDSNGNIKTANINAVAIRIKRITTP